MKTKQTILVALALLVSTIAFSQVGIGTLEPHASSILDVESTEKGFLPPRLTNAERNAIFPAVEGLTIFNTSENCMQWFNGTVWHSACSGPLSPDPVTGGETDNGFQNNTLCSPRLISVSPCASVPGATLNDDPTTAGGTEYNWNGAVGFVSGGSNQALVEIGGQCWYKRNAINVPTVPVTGWSNFYLSQPTEPAPGEGRLYSWRRATNGATGSAAERAQGICPTGFHVPSDCEWMYLEHNLGMSVADQVKTNTTRFSGDVGSKLSTLSDNANGTNSSGFTALLAGRGNFLNVEYSGRNSQGNFWTSTQPGATADAAMRSLNNNSKGFVRSASISQANVYSVRCLKD